MPPDSVFKPVDPASLEGPFSGYLQPTQQQQQAAQSGPPVLASKGTSLGYLASKFIAGASQGRVKAFEQKENEKIQKFAAFQGYVSQIYQNPNLTDEAKQVALNKLSQVMGGYGLEAAGGDKGGKGGGKGKTSTDGKPVGGIKDHIANMAKDVFQGMTGGKAPKGAPDVGSAMADLHAALFDEKGLPKPQFSVPGITQENQQDIKRKSEALPPGATYEDWMRANTTHLQALDRHNPEAGQQARRDAALQYQPAPKYGSPEYYDRQWAQTHQQSPSPPPNAGVDPNQPANVRGLGASPGTAPAAQGPPPGPPQAKTFSPGEWGLIQSAGYAGKPQGVEYTGPDGNLVRTFAQFVNTPDGQSGWFHPSGRKLEANDIRPASTAEPPRSRMILDKTYPGKDGKPHTALINADTHDMVKDYGVTPQAAGTKRSTAAFDPSQHPQVILAQRKIKTLDALNKVISQTPIPSGMEGPALAKYLWDHVQQYYKKDKDVNPYFPDILNWINEEARKGNLKDQKSVSDILQQDTGQAQQAHKEATTGAKMDHIQTQVDGVFDQMFAAPAGGGGSSYDEIDK